MKTAIRWLTLGLASLAVLLAVLLGPGRLYAIWGARQYEGRVAAIRPSTSDKAKIVETYLVELQTAERQLHVFASSDPKWVMIKQGDYVRVRLYPAPPWCSEACQWQNGGLLAKLVPPEQQDEQPVMASPQAQTAKSPPATSAPLSVAGPQAPPAKTPAPNSPPLTSGPKAPTGKPPATSNAPPPAASSEGSQTPTARPPAMQNAPPTIAPQEQGRRLRRR